MTLSNKQLDKAMVKNIENYSKQIKSLGSFIESVRKLPGMYIGYRDSRGHLNMIREVYQNSIDQVIKSNSPATWVKISFDENSHMTIVEDNGLGIPFEKMIEIFTKPHTGSNFDRDPGQFVSGMHGIGSKVTNALSKTYTVESYILGKAKRIEFIDGVPTTEEPVDIPNPDNKQGTITMFQPSSEVITDMSLSYKTVYDMVRTILSLTALGTVVYFKAITKQGKVISEKIVNEDGILYSLIANTKKPLIQPVMINNVTETMKAEIAFTYDAENMNDEVIVSFANSCPTKLGSHIKGFTEGITKYFRDYMNKIYLNERSKINIINNDIKTGLRAVVSVGHINPIFTGQAKEEFSAEDMVDYLKDIIGTSLQAWSQTNPGDLQKVAKYLKDIAEIRMKSDEGKIKISVANASVLTGLPRQYTPPNGKQNLEFWIVEGKSAGGQAKNAICKMRQGIMPIRGKIPNAMTTSPKEFLSNEEIRGIIAILGAGYGKNFDLSKVKFEKVVIGADADADGSHIDVLVLIFFLVYMRDLVEAGLLYKGVPPLYGIKKGKNMKYFVDRLDFIKYVQNLFYKNNTISTTSNIKLSVDEVTDIVYNNEDYVYELDVLANTYGANPLLLQLILNNRNKSFNEILKLVKKHFRFMDGEVINNTMTFKGLINSKHQTIFLNDRLLNDSHYVLNYLDNINRNVIDFKLNNNHTNLYELLIAFNKSGGDITRFKGLGEMNDDQLKHSTIHPDHDRTLIQYTATDIKAEVEALRRMQSNRSQLIENLQVSRQEIIG